MTTHQVFAETLPLVAGKLERMGFWVAALPVFHKWFDDNWNEHWFQNPLVFNVITSPKLSRTQFVQILNDAKHENLENI